MLGVTIQGLYCACRPQVFEAEGIDGINNMQKVDLRHVERIAPPPSADAQREPKLSKPFYDSDEDEEFEDHALGCACCPGGRSVVFRVY